MFISVDWSTCSDDENARVISNDKCIHDENAVLMVMTNVSAVDKLICLTKQVDCICCVVGS